MTRLTILEYPDPRLRTRAAPVAAVDAPLRELIDDMLETMYAANGIGLAATQVDVHRRLLVADVSESRREPRVFVNPEILSKDGATTSQEGCLSVPGYYDDVPRAERIRVRALGRDGKPFEEDLEGLLAICVQHEIDHLDGKLIIDFLSRLKRDIIVRKFKKQAKAEASAGRVHAADIGIAMGVRGSPASSEAADAVLLTDRIDRIGESVMIARRSLAIARQSVMAGLGLSVTAMVAAAFGLLPPVQGALVQEAIDLAVILNALRALR